jgi:protein-disulfide isomerase
MDAGRGRRPGVVKQQKAAGNMRPFYIALGAVAIVGAATIAWMTQRQPSRAVRTVDPAALAAAGPAEGYLYGKPDAPVTIVEFADFECPACARYATITGPDVKRRIADAGLANIKFYDYPLPQHRFSVQASIAAACASDQGKFWEMHDKLFEGQGEWSPQFANVRDPKSIFERYAGEIGVNTAQWGSCYESDKHLARIQANAAEGQRRGINQTPSFMIGNRLLPGSLSYDEVKAYVDSARARVPAAAPVADSARATSGQ